jgi:hypothetical protein
MSDILGILNPTMDFIFDFIGHGGSCITILLKLCCWMREV